MRADAHDLEDRRHQEGQKRGEGHQAAERKSAGQNLARAQIHDQRAHHAQQHGRRKTHQRRRGERLHNVIEQTLNPGGEDRRLAPLRVVALDHAHAAQRFGQPPRNLGVQFAARAEDGADGAERAPQKHNEHAQDHEGHAGERRADAQQNHQRDQSGHDAADKLDQARAHQVAHTLHIGHDARDQYARLVGVVIGDRQAAHVRLHFAPQFRDHALRRLGEELGE